MAAAAGPEGAGGLAAGPGLDLRPRRRRRTAAGPGPRPAPADRPRRVRPARAAAPGEGDARHLPLLAPAGRGARRAAGPGRLLALGAGEQAGRLLGHGRRHRHRVQAHQDQERRPDDVRDPRRRRGPGRDAGARQGLRGRRVPRRRQRSSSSAAGSTTRSAARPSWSPRRSSASSRPRTRSRGPAGARARRPIVLTHRRRASARAGRRAEGGLRALPGRGRGDCSRWRPARARAGSASATATGSSPRPRCAPSSTRCSASAPGPPEPRLPRGGLGFKSGASPNARRTPTVRVRARRLTLCPTGSDSRAETRPASAASAASFCDKLIDPRGCIEMGCRYLYTYEDIAHRQPLHGLHATRSSSGEIDLDAFVLAEPAGGFGGIKMTGEPLPALPVLGRARLRGRRPGLRVRQPQLLRLRDTAPRGSGPSTCATRFGSHRAAVLIVTEWVGPGAAASADSPDYRSSRPRAFSACCMRSGAHRAPRPHAPR